MVWVILNALGCISGGGELPQQSPIQAQMVLHADPLIRDASTHCVNDKLIRCGGLQGPSFVRRTNNLGWLAKDWQVGDRTVDVHVGPDVALAWAGDETVLVDIGAEVGIGVARETAEAGRAHFEELLSKGVMSLGVHGHDQVRDDGGLWGDIPSSNESDPCRMVEEADTVEWVLSEHVAGASVLAEVLDVDLLSLSSHVPRTMAGKVQAVNDPDGLDESQERVFSEHYQPISVSSAQSGCLSQVMDHPPFEVYRSDPGAPLLAGDGPMVVPSVRVVGSMAPHYGMQRDGSVAAARRRLIQLLVNWRYAALQEDPLRPWVFSFHAHLFDLQHGVPDPGDPDARGLDPAMGQSFRGEVEALSRVLDGLADQGAWNGIRSTSGQLVEWKTTDELTVDGSQFSFGSVAEPMSSGLQAAPYLPLVSSTLANSHYVCEVRIGSSTVYGFERCEAGWSWGQPGYGCSNGADSSWVGLVISGLDACIDIQPTGVSVAPVYGDRFERPEICAPAGMWVPREGLLVRVPEDSVLPERCASG